MADPIDAPAPFAAELRRELGSAIGECVHCGFCLPACPTYAELGREMDSPRGRIHLVEALARGRIGLSPAVERHLDLCLDCRACETACPSGVRYGEIIEGARSILEPFRSRSPVSRLMRRVALRHLLPHRRRLGLALLPLRLYRASGLRRLLRRSGLQRRLPAGLQRLERLAPRVAGRSFLRGAATTTPAAGARRGRVALFAGCIMNHAMAPVHRATVRVLARNGFETVVPAEQTCCGALHVHNGDRDAARELARRNVAAFEAASADRVIVNSAGCGAQLREYAGLLGDDPVFATRARTLAATAVDVTVFLSGIDLAPPTTSIPCRAVYDEPCHLLHAQGASTEPRALLAAIPGLDLVPLEEAEMCCGSAGVYNLTEPEMAQRLLKRKMEHVAASGAGLLITANPGCALQLEAGARERGLDIEVLHVVELLDRAYVPSSDR